MSDDILIEGTASEGSPGDGVPASRPRIADDQEAPVAPASMRFRRSRDRRVIAGVCGGLAERFDVNDNLVRLIFVVLTFFYGLGAAIYLVLWVIVRPNDSGTTFRESRVTTPVSTSHRLTMAVAVGIVALAGLALDVAHPFRLLGPGLALAWFIFLVVLAIVAIGTPARRVTLRRVAGIIFLMGTSVVVVVVGATLGLLESTGVSLNGGNGVRVWQPTSLPQVSHGYYIAFGIGTLDVSTVAFPTSGFVLVTSVAAGELRIVVPDDAVVSLTTNVGVGQVVTDSPVSISGISTQAFTSVPVGLSPAQIHRSPHLSIDARVGWGQIDLMRATSAGR